MTPLANGFAATSDPARLQELCDLVQAGTVRVFFETWMSRIPLPLTAADRDHGCWWQLAMRQVEVSRTLVFDDPRRVRTVFEELLAGNMNLGRPEHAEIIFGQKVTRRTPGVFSTRLLNRGDQVTINLSFRHSRVTCSRIRVPSMTGSGPSCTDRTHPRSPRPAAMAAGAAQPRASQRAQPRRRVVDPHPPLPRAALREPGVDLRRRVPAVARAPTRA